MKSSCVRAAVGLALMPACAGLIVRQSDGGSPLAVDPALLHGNSSNLPGAIQPQTLLNHNASSNVGCHIPPGMVQVQTNAGFQMVVLDGGDIVSDQIRSQGWWDIMQPSDLNKDPSTVLPPPSAGAFLDIGGNIGYFSLLFAHAGYTVLTVEPMTRNREALEATLCLNPQMRGSITVFPVALVSPEETSMKCIIKPTNNAINKGNGYLTCGSAADVGYCGAGCENVPVKTLDTLLSEAKPAAISTVKMDIEKYECNVLAGGSSLFQQYRPKLVRAETLYSGRQCFEDAAAAHGYRVVPLGGETLIVAN